MLVGRFAERSRLQRLIADAKDGRSRSLVLRGEAGIGKTALLDYTAGIAEGLRVLRVAGIESEAEIPYAGLHLLFSRFAGRFDALPKPQADALRAALGASSAAGERLLIGAAVLSLLSDLAQDGPVVCLVDDAHWFDQSSIDALLFAVRRLHADPVAMIFAVRDHDRPVPAAGVDSLALGRLDRTAAERLLASVRTLPGDVVQRVLDESGGNPLAIVELSAADASTPMVPLPARGRLEEHFRGLVRALPDRTRQALLIAAADERSRVHSVTDAAARLGLAAADLEPAERSTLVRVTAGTVQFRHPLIRAAAYQDASLAQRITAHRALAAALSGDPDRRAWHLAAAATGTDDAAAAELEQAAHRATARGGPAGAVRAWERAAQLSGDPADRARRLIGAARAAYDAGRLDRAAELASSGAALTGRPVERAAAGLVLAQVAYERDSPAEASARALDAVAPILTIDPDGAVGMLIEATWCARDAADPGLLARCAGLVRSMTGDRSPLLDALAGFTDLLRGDTGAAVTPVRALLQAAADGRVNGSVEQMLTGFLGVLTGADAAAAALLDRHVAALRGQGALGWLPYAVEPLAFAQLVTGRFREAQAGVAQGLALAGELGLGMQAVVLTSISAWLAAVRGDDDTCREQARLVLADTRQHRMATAQATWALALLDLTAGDPAAAADRLEAVCQGPPGRDVPVRAVADHVEAAVQTGDDDRARRYLPTLTAWAEHTGSAPARALRLRCEALLARGPDAAACFEKALAVDGRSPYDQARTHLAYGQWLRRHRRPTSARAQLKLALEAFDTTGAQGWRQRVRAEFTALGDPPPDTPASDGAGLLTPQELEVVRRAAAGLSNREIAAELFLSPRTVGYHLYKAYPKLGVARRSQLGRLDL
ncbi:ATP-binding protein [Paractinoplanes rishiriensis]|uniref:Transcriptional regulator n=1 Tax=Paractinoplanes rishiriensis TaxID=1050105 RepID=A0A919K443_9ACTN|nr:helix-turn-helix transcriptional regulator [Actinoplanes rishiriensis]GIE99838.1 transcriptional regulator [Actinoplanes rishiriensis]